MRVLPVLLAVTAVWGAAPAAASPAPVCPPDRAARPLAATTLCLINQARARHGVPGVRLDRRLARAARRHTRDMVTHHYFSHTSRAGLSSSDRIARAGWMRGRRHWIVGENLAWHAGPPSPRWIVRAWLRSRSHRHVLLRRDYRVVGIGVARATPVAGARDGATCTADFGS